MTVAIPLKRYPLRVNQSTTLISIAGFCLRLATVRGERMSAKTRCWSSHAVMVPFGETLGVPSLQTVAT
jgi:hypothetical protein